MDILINHFTDNNIPFDDMIINKFRRYFDLLTEWNNKFNLTTITDLADVQTKHFIDSLSAVDLLPRDATVVDIGSGAGFPSIPLAILRPDVKFALVDSLNKRVAFLEVVKEELSIENITTHHARAEDFADSHREEYACAVARAVAPLNILLEYLSPLVKVGGCVITYKGGSFQSEIDGSSTAMRILRLASPTIIPYLLPNMSDERVLLSFVKSGRCNPLYPRGGNRPRKMPL